MKNIRNITATLITVLIVVAGVSIAHAQEEAATTTDDTETTTESTESEADAIRTQIDLEPEDDFVVGPGKTEVIVAPGESVIRYVNVTSRVADPTTFSVVVEDLVGTDDPGQTVRLLGDQRSPNSLQDYLDPTLDQFTLELGEKISIPVEIDVPEDAEPGGYYGAVIISNAPSKADSGAQATVISRAGAIFLLRVEGPIDEAGQVTDFRLSGPNRLFYQGGPFAFETLFENTGSVHLVPYGTVTIENLFGKTVGHVPIDAYFALPDAVRYRQVGWSPGRFMVGRYSATLELNRGYDDMVDTRTIHFWVLPWKILAGTFLAILLLILTFKYVTSRFEIRKR